MREIFNGVYSTGKGRREIATKALVEGKVYDERIIKKKGESYRVWNPKKSKLSAAIVKGLNTFPITKSSKILYLGIANGTTASHISDIIGIKGIIFGVEFSPRSIGDLWVVIKNGRKNIIPILEDAHMPSKYASLVETVDVLYVDVAQPDQTDIVIRNSIFLKKGGWLMMAIKSRSISISLSPKQVFKQELDKLREKFEIYESILLDPWEKDHMFVVGKLRE